MKTAIYVENGLTQFVLTAEGEIDKKVLTALRGSHLKTYRGSFYNSQGGWIRQAETPRAFDDQYTGLWRPGHDLSKDDSLIFVIDEHGSAETDRVALAEETAAAAKMAVATVLDGTSKTCNDCAQAMFGQCDRHRTGAAR